MAGAKLMEAGSFDFGPYQCKRRWLTPRRKATKNEQFIIAESV